MNFLYNSKLDENIKTIQNELCEYSNLDRTEIFNQAINKLLMHTLRKYNNKIDDLSGYLLNQEGMRVLKAITKIQKHADKKVIYENMKGNTDG